MAAIVLLILFFSISAPLLTTNVDYSIYNPNWDGCSDMAVQTYEMGKMTPNVELASGKGLQITQRDLTSYGVVPNSSSLIILGPGETFTSQEVAYVHNFLSEGGIVLLADDFGEGNSLLEGLETESRFMDTPLMDLSFSKNPAFGVAFELREHQLTDNVSKVLLNHPTGLRLDQNATSLMNSSSACWLDVNGNGMPDKGEERKSVPLLSVEKYGEGELILISDPSIFINSMGDEMDNAELTDNVLDYVSEGRANIIFDESHREMDLIYSIAYYGDYPSRMFVLIFVGAAILLSATFVSPASVKGSVRGLVKRIPLFRRDIEEQDVIRELLNEHPDWHEKKLRKIKENFMSKEEEEWKR